MEPNSRYFALYNNFFRVGQRWTEKNRLDPDKEINTILIYYKMQHAVCFLIKVRHHVIIKLLKISSKWAVRVIGYNGSKV